MINLFLALLFSLSNQFNPYDSLVTLQSRWIVKNDHLNGIHSGEDFKSKTYAAPTGLIF